MSETGERREFCPRCGDPVPARDDPLPGEGRDRSRLLCDACYFEQFDLVDAPERIEVRVCAQCGAIHRGNRWVDVEARDYTDVAVEETRDALAVHVDAEAFRWGVEPEQVDETTIRMHTTFEGVVRDTPVEEHHTVPVKISRETCTRCGRIAGGSYAATVQIRADDRTPSADERSRAVEIAHEVVADAEADGDREAYVTEVQETDDGPDMKLSTTNLGGRVAARITEELGGGVSESATLVTEDEDGNEVHRVTYAVRLPRFRAGDVIDPDDAVPDLPGDGPVVIESVGGAVSGRRLASGEPFRTDADLSAATRHGHRGDARRTPVVAVEDAHALQVLDPDSYETVSVPHPDFFDAAGFRAGDVEEVLVVRADGQLYLVP
ncbi:MAG: 60S ribosomal export protein NMD3 [Halobaculum sp.]